MTETPGPWEVTEANNVRSAGIRIVAHVTNPADAPSIAAAPDMKKALEKIVLEFEGYASDGLDLAITAIAKAKGETT